MSYSMEREQPSDKSVGGHYIFWELVSEMKIKDYRGHLWIQAYCIVHIQLIIDVAIVVEMISPYHLWLQCH